MIRLARQASLLVAFCLLASAATAYAECAWVLWTTWSTPLSQSTGPLQSFRSLGECEKELYGESIKKMVDDAKINGKLVFPQCLPDTVDPRGPKGGR